MVCTVTAYESPKLRPVVVDSDPSVEQLFPWVEQCDRIHGLVQTATSMVDT